LSPQLPSKNKGSEGGSESLMQAPAAEPELPSIKRRQRRTKEFGSLPPGAQEEGGSRVDMSVHNADNSSAKRRLTHCP
jgi:hypothetical protein